MPTIQKPSFCLCHRNPVKMSLREINQFSFTGETLNYLSGFQCQKQQPVFWLNNFYQNVMPTKIQSAGLLTWWRYGRVSWPRWGWCPGWSSCWGGPSSWTPGWRDQAAGWLADPHPPSPYRRVDRTVVFRIRIQIKISIRILPIFNRYRYTVPYGTIWK